MSYNEKHNEANGEQNRDGANDNYSWNCGVEGPTDDPEIERLRERQVKNFLALNLLAVGTPMLLAGDEVRRTQQGNNNAYCQDNEISWFDWSLVEKHAGLRRFVKLLLACRLDPDRDTADRDATLTEFLDETRPALARREARRARLEPALPQSRGHRAGPRGWERSCIGCSTPTGSRWMFELPPVPPEFQGPWRRWVDTAREPPEDICEWRCGCPVTTTHYHVQPRSLVILVLRSTPPCRDVDEQ